jgi:hypothetical protein
VLVRPEVREVQRTIAALVSVAQTGLDRAVADMANQVSAELAAAAPRPGPSRGEEACQGPPVRNVEVQQPRGAPHEDQAVMRVFPSGTAVKRRPRVLTRPEGPATGTRRC